MFKKPFFTMSLSKSLSKSMSISMSLFLSLVLSFAALLFSSIDAGACASCGCTLSSDWDNLQFSSTSGLKIDLRYDFLNQNQLRSGAKTISPADASRVLNDGDPQEVEKYTRNHYITLGVDYGFNRDWGVNVQFPYINRAHSTLGTASDGFTSGDDGEQYDSHTSNPGDIKLTGRYQGFLPQGNLGVLFGLKLPTGRYKLTGQSTDPTAPDPVPIDRGLQPGTGTTDIILGAYYTNALNPYLDYFAQALFQSALYSTDEYRPGEGFNLNLGLRYLGFRGFNPQVQLNLRHVLHDTGENADTFGTGGTLAYVSPGIIASIGDNVSVYGFVQLPVYQNVRGVQLTPRFTTSVGVRHAL